MKEYSERFNKFLPVILKHEGNYSNNHDDAGKETYAGISRKANPRWRGWVIIDSLKPFHHKKKLYKENEELREAIYELYNENYYLPLKLDSFDNEELAIQLFDFAVNAGVKQAVKTLQRILQINADGLVGRQTINTANVTKGDLAGVYKQKRIEFYNQIALKGNNKKFLKGWLNRVESCKL